jgi:hypothetical protein
VAAVDNLRLSPLAVASRDLVVRLSTGASPGEVEAGCRELLTENTNGLGSVDTRVVEVATEIVCGVLIGVSTLRSPAITAAARGVCETGESGEAGDAERLKISERVCRDVRNSDDASMADYRSALEGASPAARMSADALDDQISRAASKPRRHRSG